MGGLLTIVPEGGDASFPPVGLGAELPSGVHFRIAAGPVTGGGYLSYREATAEYGGVSQLAFGSIDLFAMALIKPEPELSFVALIGARFLPKIELGFGFTLNGVGGLLAYNREVSIDGLSAGVRSDVVSNLLFPSDPVASAPTILNQLGAIFPEKSGAFAIGPMFDLGWGSQAEIVRARIGMVIAPPEPLFVVLGAVSIKVPPDPPGATVAIPKIVDLNLDMLAVISAGQFYLRAALTNSVIAGQSVQGDLGLFIRWSGSAQFAISAGGFFPGYPAPKELGDLKVLVIPIKSPFGFLSINASGYFALLTNSVQVGGQISLIADLDPARGEAYFGLDALFEWAPTLHFRFEVRAGIKLSFFGETVTAVSFRGSLEGTSPWRLSGYASVSVLCWDIEFDLGPYTWGEVAEVTKAINVLASVAEALANPEAWAARSSRISQYRLRAIDPGGPVLIAPGSIVSVQQTLLPFDTFFERVGAFPTKEHELNFANPRFGTTAAALSSQATGQFAPGQFLDLEADEQLSRPPFESLPAGIEMAVADTILMGDSSERKLDWETIEIAPESNAQGRTFRMPGTAKWQLNGIADSLSQQLPLARQRRAISPYDELGPGPAPIGVRQAGLKQVVSVETRANNDEPRAFPTSAAAHAAAVAGGLGAGMQIRAARVSA